MWEIRQYVNWLPMAPLEGEKHCRQTSKVMIADRCVSSRPWT